MIVGIGIACLIRFGVIVSYIVVVGVVVMGEVVGGVLVVCVVVVCGGAYPESFR